MKFRVKELAAEQKISAEDLARRADLKYSAVKNLWQGRTGDPRYSTLRSIARALGVPIEQLEASENGSGNTKPVGALA